MTTKTETCKCGHNQKEHNEIYDERDKLVDLDECLLKRCPCKKFTPIP